MTPLPLMALLLGSTPQPVPDLDALVSAVGAEEQARAASTCTFVERTVVHELDGDGEVTGTVTREFDVTLNATSHRRALRSETFEGEPSRLMRRHAEPEEQTPHPGPFHPDERAHFRYELASHGGGRAVIRFEPLEPHEKRMKGSAVVNLSSRRLLRLEVEPSKTPRFVDALKLDFAYADTPCGQRPVKVTARGSGGMLFLKVRFRTESTLSGYQQQQAASR